MTQSINCLGAPRSLISLSAFRPRLAVAKARSSLRTMSASSEAIGSVFDLAAAWPLGGSADAVAAAEVLQVTSRMATCIVPGNLAQRFGDFRLAIRLLMHPAVQCRGQIAMSGLSLTSFRVSHRNAGGQQTARGQRDESYHRRAGEHLKYHAHIAHVLLELVLGPQLVIVQRVRSRRPGSMWHERRSRKHLAAAEAQPQPQRLLCVSLSCKRTLQGKEKPAIFAAGASTQLPMHLAGQLACRRLHSFVEFSEGLYYTGTRCGFRCP